MQFEAVAGGVVQRLPGQRYAGLIGGLNELWLFAKHVFEVYMIPESGFEATVDENLGGDSIVDGVADGLEEAAEERVGNSLRSRRGDMDSDGCRVWMGGGDLSSGRARPGGHSDHDQRCEEPAEEIESFSHVCLRSPSENILLIDIGHALNRPSAGLLKDRMKSITLPEETVSQCFYVVKSRETKNAR
jgi:hypothetical protein